MPKNSTGERWLQIDTRPGDPIQAGESTLTPFATALRIRIPGVPAGLVWNRPTSILVQDSSGQERVMIIQDPTRIILWALLGSCVLTALFAWLVRRRKQ